jgi:hypothetical protein
MLTVISLSIQVLDSPGPIEIQVTVQSVKIKQCCEQHLSMSGLVTMLGADWDYNTMQRWILVFSFISSSVVDGHDNQIVLNSAKVFIFIVRGQIFGHALWFVIMAQLMFSASFEHTKGCMALQDVYVCHVDLMGLVNREAAVLFGLNVAKIIQIAFSHTQICNDQKDAYGETSNAIDIVVHEAPDCNKVERLALLLILSTKPS